MRLHILRSKAFLSKSALVAAAVSATFTLAGIRMLADSTDAPADAAEHDTQVNAPADASDAATADTLSAEEKAHNLIHGSDSTPISAAEENPEELDAYLAAWEKIVLKNLAERGGQTGGPKNFSNEENPSGDELLALAEDDEEAPADEFLCDSVDFGTSEPAVVRSAHWDFAFPFNGIVGTTVARRASTIPSLVQPQKKSVPTTGTLNFSAVSTTVAPARTYTLGNSVSLFSTTTAATSTGTYDLTWTDGGILDANNNTVNYGELSSNKASFEDPSENDGDAYTVTVSGDKSISSLSVRSGDVTMSGNAVSVSGDATISSGASLTVNNTLSVAGTLKDENGSGGISGSGRIDLGSTGTVSGTWGEGWTGTVAISNRGSADTGWTLSNYGRLGSSVSLLGISGYFTTNGGSDYNSTVSVNLILENSTVGEESYAFKALNGFSGFDCTFSGSVSGSGNFIHGDDARQNYVFTGDLSAFSGNFSTSTDIVAGDLVFGDGGEGITSGSVSGTGTINWDSNREGVVFNYSNNVFSSSTITGATKVVKKGTGTLTLTGTNTYTGTTTVSAGTLNVTNSEALGTGAITFAGDATLGVEAAAAAYSLLRSSSVTTAVELNEGIVINSGVTATYQVDETEQLTLSGVISGDGALEKTGAGELILTGTNTYTGGTTISGGIVDISNSEALGTGAITFAGDATLAGGLTDAVYVQTNYYQSGGLILNETITLNAVGTFEVGTDETLILSNTITGSGALTKTGEGTLILSGTGNSYTGGVTISAGRLLVSNHDNACGAGTITVNEGARLSIHDSILANTIVNNGLVYVHDNADDTLHASGLTGDISGSGTLTIENCNSTFILSGNNSYTGGTTITNSSVAVTQATAFGTGTVTMSGSEINGLVSTTTEGVTTTSPLTFNNKFIVRASDLSTLYGNIGSKGSLTISGNLIFFLSGNLIDCAVSIDKTSSLCLFCEENLAETTVEIAGDKLSGAGTIFVLTLFGEDSGAKVITDVVINDISSNYTGNINVPTLTSNTIYEHVVGFGTYNYTGADAVSIELGTDLMSNDLEYGFTGTLDNTSTVENADKTITLTGDADGENLNFTIGDNWDDVIVGSGVVSATLAQLGDNAVVINTGATLSLNDATSVSKLKTLNTKLTNNGTLNIATLAVSTEDVDEGSSSSPIEIISEGAVTVGTLSLAEGVDAHWQTETTTGLKLVYGNLTLDWAHSDTTWDADDADDWRVAGTETDTVFVAGDSVNFGADANGSGYSIAVTGDKEVGALTVSGNVTLTGDAVSVSGETTVSGTLIVGNAIAFGGAVTNNGTLNVNNDDVSFGADIANNGALVFNASNELSKNITGTGTLTVASGTLTLSGTNTYTGGTTVSSEAILVAESDNALPRGALSLAGTLSLGNGTNVKVSTLTGTGTVRLADGATSATLTVSTSEDCEFAGTIGAHSAITVVKEGEGELTLTGNTQVFSYDDSLMFGLSVSKGRLNIRDMANGVANSFGKVSVNENATLGVSLGPVSYFGIWGTSFTFASGSELAVDVTLIKAPGEGDEVTLTILSGTITYGDGATTLNGGNLQSFVSAYVSDVQVASWVKKTEWNTNSDSDFSTLTLTLSVPEPSMFGLLVGMGALALVTTRRRRIR